MQIQNPAIFRTWWINNINFNILVIIALIFFFHFNRTNLSVKCKKIFFHYNDVNFNAWLSPFK